MNHDTDIGAAYNTITITIWGDGVSPTRDDHTQTITDIITTNPHAHITIRTHPDHTPAIAERLTAFTPTHQLTIVTTANHATHTLNPHPDTPTPPDAPTA